MNGFLANSAHKIYCSPLFPSSLRIISSGRCITAQHHSKLKKMNLRRYLCNGLNYFPNCQNFEGLFFANKKHWSKFLIILTIKTRRNFKKKVSSRKRQGGNRGHSAYRSEGKYFYHIFSFAFLLTIIWASLLIILNESTSSLFSQSYLCQNEVRWLLLSVNCSLFLLFLLLRVVFLCMAYSLDNVVTDGYFRREMCAHKDFCVCFGYHGSILLVVVKNCWLWKENNSTWTARVCLIWSTWNNLLLLAEVITSSFFVWLVVVLIVPACCVMCCNCLQNVPCDGHSGMSSSTSTTL